MAFSLLDFRRYLRRAADSRYHVYTDGSSKAGTGAWAFVVLKDEKLLHESSASVKNGNSNRMEIQAAVMALSWIPRGSEVLIHTDSRILLESVTQSLAEWKTAKWINKYGRPVFNSDLFQKLHDLCDERRVSWKWIRAHSGDPYNERCDELCTQARLGRL